MNWKVRSLIVAVTLLIGLIVFPSVQVQTVQGLVPGIQSITFHNVGSTTTLDVTVFHQGSPTPIGASHYVSNVQLEINGTVVNLSQSPQSTETFTVQYSLGPNTNTYTVVARALCNVHGYGGNSSPVVVPESISVVLFIVLATVAAIVAKKTRRTHSP